MHAEINRLERQGYNVWYDKGELQPAHFWAEEIRQAISACTCFMVFITEDSVLSRNVSDEIEQALEANKPFIAVYWDNVELPAGLQKPVRSRHTLDRHSMHQAAYEEPLSKTLAEHIPHAATRANDGEIAPRLTPAIPTPGSDVFPKLVCFGLAFLGAVSFFLAIVVAVAPNIISVKSPDDIINNRLIGLVGGITFIFIGLLFSGTAVVVFRKYLWRTT